MEEDIIKIEFIEEDSPTNGEHDVPAQALMTLHDSVQNMPNKQKSALQVAVADASPLKRLRTDSFEGYSIHHHRLKPLSPMRFPNEPRVPEFSGEQMQVMNQYYSSIKTTLKQPTGRRWAYYEWFYSNIDRALLLGNNDFEQCLQQIFKNLKTRKLTTSQWTLVRRMMGKPRRCSAAFLKEERQLLEDKRKKIRYLHQLKGFEVTDMSQFKDLPEEIPMPMVIGTKVTAKVPYHFDDTGLSLFTGTVDAVDNVNNTYRINFDREGIGSHSIPDTDVASEEYEAMNLQLFIVKERPKIAGANSPESSSVQRKSEKEDHANSSPARLRLAEALNNETSGTYGGFPIQFLLYMSSLSKAIVLKKQYIDKLKQMNSEVELRQPFGRVTREFQKNYAFVVLELDKINKEMDTIFENIERFLRTVAPQIGALDQTMNVRNQCNEKARHLIEQSQRIVADEQMRQLTLKFTSLMLQINHVAESGSCSAKLSILDQTVKDIKRSLCPENLRMFEDKVETSIAFLKNGMQEGKSMLAAFTSNKQKAGILPVDNNSSTEEMYDDDEEEGDDEEEEEEIKDTEDVFEL